MLGKHMWDSGAAGIEEQCAHRGGADIESKDVWLRM